MVKHIVLFKLKENINEIQKKEAMETFRAKILALPKKISWIRHIEVDFNINPAEKWDICLNSDFDTIEEVKSYSIYPDHLAAAGGLKPNVEERACVDYEY